MAILDNILRQKPAASVNTLETSILWLYNKPSEWLDQLSEDDRENIVSDARKNAGKLSAKNQRTTNKAQTAALREI